LFVPPKAGSRVAARCDGPRPFLFSSTNQRLAGRRAVPFNWPSTIDQILDAPFLNDADKKAILGGNASKWLKI
jgi:hypothetical protein